MQHGNFPVYFICTPLLNMVFNKNLINLLFAVALTVMLFGCEEKLKPVPTGINPADTPDYESWNPEVIFSDSSKIKAVLRAGYIAYFSSAGYTLIDSGAVVDFYKEDEIVSTLTGERGKVFDQTKDIEIIDNITVISKDGSELKSSRLYWTELTQRVSSDTFVTIKTPTEQIQGFGFESDQELKNYRIYKVTGTFSN